MRCRQLRKQLGRLAAIVVVVGLVWRVIPDIHSAPPEPRGEQILPADDHAQPAKKNAAIPPVTHRAKTLYVEQGVTCASGGGPAEGRVFHLSAANVTAEECVQRCRVEDACAIFTWVQVAGGEAGVGNCWYRIGGRKGTWLARHAATNAVSGCSTDAVAGCDPAQPYQLKEVLHASDVARAENPDSDATVHPACPMAFRKRWTAGATALMLELLDQLHSELEELRVPYSLFGATLLGQMRHGGFIPWQVGQAQIVLRHKDVGAVRHQLQPDIASKSTTAGRYVNTKGRRRWIVTDKKTGFRLQFAEVDGKLNDLHRSFFVDVFVVGADTAFGIPGPSDILLPETTQLAPFHSRMYRVSIDKWALLKLGGITR